MPRNVAGPAWKKELPCSNHAKDLYVLLDALPTQKELHIPFQLPLPYPVGTVLGGRERERGHETRGHSSIKLILLTSWAFMNQWSQSCFVGSTQTLASAHPRLPSLPGCDFRPVGHCVCHVTQSPPTLFSLHFAQR